MESGNKRDISNKSKSTLSRLPIGQSAQIISVGGQGALRQHLLNLGIIPGAVVKMIKLAPMGDPMEIRVHGYELTLRRDDADQIEIVPAEVKEDVKEETQTQTKTEHPGLGEGGKFHPKGSGYPLPDDTL